MSDKLSGNILIIKQVGKIQELSVFSEQNMAAIFLKHP